MTIPDSAAGSSAAAGQENSGGDWPGPLPDLGDINLEELAELPFSALKTSLARILDLGQRDSYVAFNSSI
ncbi:hypothetical protein GCM10022223_11240 [Kineosporia mesophila]|uniref:FXSXX-COOH protein n=1 Tax=Kineosporia mesophila TaxID=566012 RepID=A0ABP6Z781_9ACTN|nr:FxSxx-COOH cyclophane-containing RiPP peptide [Kineosporia mesophila]MCD5352601.1 FxSxx-COOH protein [Kineosporia mesophila]